MEAKRIEASQFFLCAICQDEYRDPRLLHCGHSFCLECLEIWSQQRQNKGVKIVCPSCKEITPLKAREGGAKLLPVDFKINQIKDAFSGVVVSRYSDGGGNATFSTKCGFCKEKSLVSFCSACEKTLCEQCEEKHKNNTLFRTHTTEPVLCNRFTTLLCELHSPEAIKYFCVTCNKAMCALCAMDSKHVDHNTTSLNEGLEQCAKSLKKLLKPLNDQETAITSMIADAESKNNDIETNLVRSKELIQNVTDDLIEKIQQWEYNLVQQLETTHDEAKEECNAYICLLKKEEDKIKKLTKAITSIDSQHSNFGSAVVTQSESIMKEIKELTSKGSDPFQITLPSFEVPHSQPDVDTFLNSNFPLTTKELVSYLYEDAWSWKPSGKNIQVQSYEDCEPKVGPYENVALTVPSAQLIWSVDRRSTQIGNICSPVSVTFSPEVDILVSEVDGSRVQIFDISGQSIGVISDVSVPKGTVVDHSNGDIYIIDAGSCQVKVYNKQYNLTMSWGKRILQEPRSIAFTHSGTNVVVVDKKSNKVMVLTKEGKLLHSSSGFGPAELKCPVDVAVDSSDRIIVADRSLHSIEIFDEKCHAITSINTASDLASTKHPQNGSTRRSGQDGRLTSRPSEDSSMTNVQSVCVDSRDNIYVCLHDDNCVVKYDCSGNYCGVVLSRDVHGIQWPCGVAFSSSGYIAVVESKFSQNHSALKLFKLL